MISLKNRIFSQVAHAAFVAALFLIVPNLVHGQSVTIDQAWLSSRGSSPYYLDQADTTYVLGTDVSTPGTAFAIIADGVSFDLNGRTITYDNNEPVAVPNGSFEQGSGTSVTGWDFSSAPSGQVALGPYTGRLAWTGPQALAFSVPASGQPDTQFVRGTQSVTLEPNTTYDLSFRGFNGVRGADDVTLYVTLEGTSVEASRTGRTWRGFQYTTATFTTGSAPETHTIVAGLRGATSTMEASGNVYIDDIRIQRHAVYGVVAGPQSWGEDWERDHYPDLSRFGSATNAVIKNGTITQGPGRGNVSHGVYEFRSENIELAQLTVTVHGPNSINFGAYYASGVNIHDNTFYSNVDTITSRDNFHGQVITAGSNGEVYNNTIIGGCQNGIVVSEGMRIHHNTISLRSRYTNGFAIQLYGDEGSEVYENTIRCGQGEFASRGIFVGGNAQGTKVWNNVVEVQELPINQEYGGGQGGYLSGAYGIQVESSDNIEIWGNVVTGYAREWTASAFRMNAALADRNIYVHHNVFNALKMGRGGLESNDENLLTANSVKIDGGIDSANTQLRFEYNTLASNSRWIACSSISNLDFKHTTFAIKNEPLDPFQPITAVRYRTDNSDAITDLKFTDSRFGDAAARTALINAPVYKKFYTNFGPDSASSYYLAWILAVKVQNGSSVLPNAQVQVLDRNGSEVFSGTTNSEGSIQTILNEHKMTGDQKEVYGPYQVRVTDSTHGTRNTQVTLDRSKTIVVNFGANQPPLVNAGEDQHVRLSVGAYLHGTVVDEGEPTSISWTKVSGPGRVTFGNASGLDTKADLSANGDYVLRLTVTDDQNQTASDDVTIHVTGGGIAPAAPRNLRLRNRN